MSSLTRAWQELKVASVHADVTRLRIGYVSTGFGEHPRRASNPQTVSAHDHQRFEIFGYSLVPDDGSEYRQTLLSL
ncbi:MAG: hypothetical protein R3F37_16350 [Candidatus Competibacteraceae bacterium]